MKRKAVSILLTAVLLISVLPLSVFAATPVVTLDTPLTLVPGANVAEATFTPTETGVYEFRSESVNALDPAGPALALFDDEDEVDVLAGNNDLCQAYRLVAGKTYTLAVTDDMTSTAGVNITATKAEVKTLTMNTPLTVVPGDGFAYATFTPEKDGEYSFASAAVSNADPCLRWLDYGRDEDCDIIAGKNDDYDGYQFWVSYKLHAGYTYTLALFDYNNISDGFTVTVSNYHEILTQPTAGEPSVKATTPEEAAFQWHQVDMVTVPLTNDNSAVVNACVYDDIADQWIGDDRDDNYWLLDLWLHPGESLTVKSADKILVEDCTAYNDATGNACKIEAVDANTVRFTSSGDMVYKIWVATDGTNDRFDLTLSSLKLGSKINGQTTDTLTKFEKNKYYACTVSYPDSVSITSNFFRMEETVAKQPTATDPTIQVTFPEDVKGYQWYEMNINKTTPLTPDKVADYDGDYDAQTGEWTGTLGWLTEDVCTHNLFLIDLHQGQTLFIEATDPVLPEYSYFAGENVTGTIAKIDEYTLALTATQDGIYYISIAICSADTTFKGWIGSMEMGDAISGQTTATLTDYDKDGAYLVKVTYQDGVQVTSEIVMMSVAIVKQPTAADPTVKVNFEDEVKSYQWYTYDKTPITDQNAKGYEYNGGKGAYNSTAGTWSGTETHWEFGDYGYFVIDLKAGDRVLLDAGVQLENFIILEDMADQNHWIASDPVNGEGRLHIVEADKDGSYYVTILDDNVTAVKAWLLKLAPVTGEDKAELKQAKAGNSYFCEITYKDGDILTSDSFEADKATALVIEAAAADENDKTAQQALLDKVNELLKDKNLTEQEKKVLGALKLKLEQNIAAIEQAEANKKPAGGSVNTGLFDYTWLWLALLVLSGGGIATATLYGKKKPTA